MSKRDAFHRERFEDAAVRIYREHQETVRRQDPLGRSKKALAVSQKSFVASNDQRHAPGHTPILRTDVQPVGAIASASHPLLIRASPLLTPDTARREAGIDKDAGASADGAAAAIVPLVVENASHRRTDRLSVRSVVCTVL